MLIKKGKVILNVTKGAFDALFKADGWEMTDGASDEAELHNGTIFMSAGVPAEQTAEDHATAHGRVLRHADVPPSQRCEGFPPPYPAR